MKKIISYALFGYGKEASVDWFEFNTYLRGLMINIRMQQLLMPDWKIRVYIDRISYEKFQELFDALDMIEIVVESPAELSRASLWRLKPLFDAEVEYMISRDLDSILTYRDAQAVKDWIDSGKCAHAITDSEGHGIPMLAGMIGFWCKYWKDYTNIISWDQIVEYRGNYSVKGTDQDIINQMIYPMFANRNKESILQHYVKGMPNTFLNGYRNHIPDVDLGIDTALKSSNSIAGHIGAAGWYETELFKFMNNYHDQFERINKLEKLFPTIFYWNF